MKMERREIEEKVNDFLVEEMEIEADKIKPEALLKEDLGLDSLDFVGLSSALLASKSSPKRWPT